MDISTILFGKSQKSGGDRRVKRTLRQLHAAVADLIFEKGYDDVSVRDVIDRADVGRATFYLHFQSKKELFLSSHRTALEHLQLGSYTREELLDEAPSAKLRGLFEYVDENRRLFRLILAGRDSEEIMRAFRTTYATNLEGSLRSHFDEASSSVPFNLLARQYAEMMVGSLLWWIETRAPYSAEQMVSTYQSALRAGIGAGLARNVAISNSQALAC